MMRTALAAVALAALSGSTPVLGPPRVVATLPQARPEQLDIAPDGRQLYVDEAAGGEIVDAATGETRKAAAPAWAADYWRAKSARVNPADPNELIALVSGTIENISTVQGPNWTDLSISGVYSPLHPTQRDVRSVINLELRKTVIGTFVGTSAGDVVPGVTFGWAPGSLGWIAYRDAKGRLALMNPGRHSFVVAGTSNVWLPAWTPDGTRILFVELNGTAAVISEVRVDTNIR